MVGGVSPYGNCLLVFLDDVTTVAASFRLTKTQEAATINGLSSRKTRQFPPPAKGVGIYKRQKFQENSENENGMTAIEGEVSYGNSLLFVFKTHIGNNL